MVSLVPQRLEPISLAHHGVAAVGDERGRVAVCDGSEHLIDRAKQFGDASFRERTQQTLHFRDRLTFPRNGGHRVGSVPQLQSPPVDPP